MSVSTTLSAVPATRTEIIAFWSLFRHPLRKDHAGSLLDTLSDLGVEKKRVFWRETKAHCPGRHRLIGVLRNGQFVPAKMPVDPPLRAQFLHHRHVQRQSIGRAAQPGPCGVKVDGDFAQAI